MSKITSVEPQKKNPHRYNIFLDGKFAFGADEDTLVEYRLIVGKELTLQDQEKVVFATGVGKLMERMYGLLARRMRSEREIRDYLRNLSFKRKVKGDEELSDIVCDALIERLKEKDLVNDQRFAQEWVSSRGVRRGPNVLKAELMQKGIDKEIIDEVMNEHNDLVSEDRIAQQALEKKMKSFSSLDPVTFKRKAIEFLLRRGFNYETARTVVEKSLKKG